jgi:hypothetical protein
MRDGADFDDAGAEGFFGAFEGEAADADDPLWFQDFDDALEVAIARGEEFLDFGFR